MDALTKYADAIRRYEAANAKLELLVSLVLGVAESLRDYPSRTGFERMPPGTGLAEGHNESSVKVFDLMNWPDTRDLVLAVMSRLDACRDLRRSYTDLSFSERANIKSPDDLNAV